MAAALPEVPNGTAAGPVKNAEAAALAREKGWVEPEAYDYVENTADSKPAPGENFGSGDFQWAHDAAKYEWKEEFGDVGPKIPELEEQLFQSEHLLRKGNMYEK